MSNLKLYNWRTITTEFKDSCDGLEIGELVKDNKYESNLALCTSNYLFNKIQINNSFGLFEAMSAIELMDPKMDAGMLSNQSQAKIKSLSQAVQVG